MGDLRGFEGDVSPWGSYKGLALYVGIGEASFRCYHLAIMSYLTKSVRSKAPGVLSRWIYGPSTDPWGFWQPLSPSRGEGVETLCHS